MLYRFRICHDPDLPDDAQGWVIASCDYEAQHYLGPNADLYCMPRNPVPDLPNGTVLVTKGKLEHVPGEFTP